MKKLYKIDKKCKFLLFKNPASIHKLQLQRIMGNARSFWAYTYYEFETYSSLHFYLWQPSMVAHM